MTDEQIRALLAEHARDVKMDARHCYWISTNGKWKRAKGVTAIVGQLDKPHLNKWHVRMEREAGAAVAYQVYLDALPPGLDFTDFSKEFLARCHKEYEGQRIAERSANIGTGVHKLIEHHQKRALGIPCEYPDVPDESHFAFIGWEEWAEANRLRPVIMEQMVYSRRYWYAGTLDWLGYKNDKLTVIDWKPKPPWPSYRLQLGGYWNCLAELGIDADIEVVRIWRDKPGPVESYPIQSKDKCFEAFLYLRKLAEWLNTLPKYMDNVTDELVEIA